MVRNLGAALLTLITLAIRACHPAPENGRLQLRLELISVETMLPDSSIEFPSARFRCYLENQGSSTIVVVTPGAYKIAPHPWSIRSNGVSSRLWQGAGCAPSFAADDKISLSAGQKVVTEFSWSSYERNFPTEPGTYRVSVRYYYCPWGTSTSGSDKDGITEQASSWSNEVLVEIPDSLSSS
jgi:hypothetical protein